MSAFKPWAMHHLDLLQPIPPLASEPETGGVFLVLWCGSTPLAHVELESARLPLDAFALREEIIRAISPTLRGYLRADDKAGARADMRFDRLLRDLEVTLPSLLQTKLPPRSARIPSASVVVCTRDRPQSLSRCLDSLARLTLKPQQILVVDNCPSNPETAELVRARAGVDYVREPAPGLDRARNTGVRASRGQIVAYVDDDVTVHPDWLARTLEGFSDESVMAVTGLVLPGELETEPQLLFERYWGFNRGYVPRLYDRSFYLGSRSYAPPVWEIGAGANMAFRRDAFERLGGFDQRLDAGAAGVAGDSEFWYRILFAGFSCRYQPSAVVFHWHRREMEQLRRQIFAYMRGHVAALLIQHERYRDMGNLRRLFTGLPRYYANTTLRALKRHHRPRASTLGAELTGCAAGVRYYLETRREASRSVPMFKAGGAAATLAERPGGRGV